MSLFILSGSAIAGLGGGGTPTHTWTGNISNNWSVAGNWNTHQVPGVGHSVIVDGGLNNAALSANSAQIRSLFVGGGLSLYSNGFVLQVTNNTGSTTVNGINSTLVVAPTGASFGFDTKTLELQSHGRLHLNGGSAIVREQATMTAGGRVMGTGYLEVTSASPAAFNGGAGSDITASGGELEINVVGGGSIAVPPVMYVLTNADLLLNGPLFLPVNNVNLQGGSGFSSANNWMLAGTLAANTAGGSTASVYGNGTGSIEGAISVANNSHLRFDTNVNFESTADVSIGSGGTLELNEFLTSDAGHLTTIAHNGRLLLNAAHSGSGWDGNINSTAGIIETNAPFGLRVDGALTLGSFGGLRTILTGSSSVIATGTVSAPGLGAIVNGTFDVSGSANMSLGLNASIIVNGNMILRANSTSFGAGVISVQPGGQLQIQQNANVGVDIVNAGDFRLGTFSNQNVVEINGTFNQAATGRMLMDIGGEGESQRDFLQVWDDATLAGTLHISLLNGFVPEVGSQYQVLAANSIAGGFTAVTGAPGFSISQQGNSVFVTYDGVGLLGDINNDGFVNVTDLLMVIAAWGAVGANPADVNGDGLVNVTDLLIVIANWT